MERKWMKDWENFDWEPVKEALDKKEKEGIKDMDIGITIDEFLDFMGWLLVHDKAMFSKLMLSKYWFCLRISLGKWVRKYSKL